MSLAFSRSPLPQEEECEGLVEGVEMALLAIVSHFYRLPSDQGGTLLQALTAAILEIVLGVQLLSNSLQKEYSKAEQLQSTGSVWDACDAFANLPHDNKQAALSRLSSISALVKDAVEELEEAKANKGTSVDFCLRQEEDGETEQTTAWTEEEEKLVAAPCSGLAKGCRSLLKKLSASLTKNCRSPPTAQENKDLDCVIENMQPLSEKIDDMISGIYSPIDFSVTCQNVHELAGLMESVISAFRGGSLFSANDQEWADFLTMAIRHNVSKLG
eukprot:m.221754 g.221754  ORF g.221754 m.221754 type:complete len:272 (+) comp39965_c0_seq3:252-1067(+)